MDRAIGLCDDGSAEVFPDGVPVWLVERREISRGPAGTAEEGEPVVVEVCEDHRDDDRAPLDGEEPRLSKGGLQVAGVTDARLAPLIERGRCGIDGHGRVPEQTDGCHAIGVVPDVGADHAARCEHPPPFAKRRTDVGDEVQDEATDHDVDRAIREPRLDRRPSRNDARGSVSVIEARSMNGSAGSMPMTALGSDRLRIASVRAPVPQPTSSHRRPGGTSSQPTNWSATSRLQRPLYRS